MSELLLPGFPNAAWATGSAVDLELTQQGDDWVCQLLQGPGGKLFSVGDFTFRVPKGKPAGGGATARVILVLRARGQRDNNGQLTPTGIVDIDLAQLEIEVSTNQVGAASLQEAPYRKLVKLKDEAGNDKPVAFRGPALRLSIDVGKALSNLLSPTTADQSPIVSLKALSGPLTNPTVENNVPLLSADPPHFVSKDGGVGATCGTARLYLGAEGPGGAGDTFRGFTFDQFGVYLNNEGAPDSWSGMVKMKDFKLALNPARVSGKFWAEILHHTRFSPRLQVTAWYRTSPSSPELPTSPHQFAGGSIVNLAAPAAPWEFLPVRLKVAPTWRLPGATDPDEDNLFMKPGGHRVRWRLPPDALPEARGRLDELEVGWVRFPPGAHRVEVSVFDPRFADDESQGWAKETVTLVVPGPAAGLAVVLEATRPDAKPLQPLPEWPTPRSRLHIDLDAGEQLSLSAKVFGMETGTVQVSLACEPDSSGGGLTIQTPDLLLPVPSAQTPRPAAAWTIAIPDDIQRLAAHGALVVTAEPALTSGATVSRRLRYTLHEAPAPGQARFRLEPEEDWIESGGVARIGVRLGEAMREDDFAWTIEDAEAGTNLFSSAADDLRFVPGPMDGFPAGGWEQKSYAWSAGVIGPYLETPNRLWRLTATVTPDPTKRPRGAIVVGEEAASLRLSQGGAELPRLPAPVAFRPLYGPTNGAADDRFILFPRDVSLLGADGTGETWTPATGIQNTRTNAEIREVQLRGLADLLWALFTHADGIERIDLYGVASSEGLPEHNLELGQERADALSEFVEKAIGLGPSAALQAVAGNGVGLPPLPADAAFRSRCGRLATVPRAAKSLGTLASRVENQTIDTNDRRAFVILHRSDAAVPAATAITYLTTRDGAPARHETLVPVPLSAKAHPLRHHWLRKARIEVELKENKLVAALAHMLLDTSRINRPNLPPPVVDDLGKVETNSDLILIGFTLAYKEVPPASTGGSPRYELVGDVYAPPEDKDGLKAWNPATSARFLADPGKSIAGAAITVPAAIALADNRLNGFLGLGAAVAGAAAVRTSRQEGKSLLNPTRLVLRGFRLTGGWERDSFSFIDVGVSYEVSYTVNVDLNKAVGLSETDPIKLVITSDPDTGVPGKPITMRLRNVAVRIFADKVPEFRYHPELGFDVDLPDPGLLRLSGLGGASAALAKFLTIRDVKIERNNPLSTEGTIDFKFNGGFFKIGGLTFKASVDFKRLFSEGVDNQSISLDVTPTAKAITLGAEIKNVLKGSGEVRIGNPIGGDVDLTLEALKLRLYASFNVWLYADFSAVFAAAGFEISPGFPLFTTGLGLQGLEALVGVNIERTDQDPLNLLSWYRGANAPDSVGVAKADKWTPKRGAFAFGAGVKIGTLADKGFSWWIKGVLVVQIPGPQIFIAARCGFFTPKKLQPSAKDKTEGGLLAVILLDLARNVFFAGVDFTLEQKKVFKFQAPVRIYFNLNNGRDFYIRFGQISPAGGQLIEMEALEYFRAWAYLQIEGAGFQTNRLGFPPLVLTGPCVAFGFRTEIRIGAPPLAWFQASLELHIGLQIKPFYMDGSLLAIGEAGLLGCSIEARASVLARAGSDTVSIPNREVLYLRIEASFSIRILFWTPPPITVKVEIGSQDAALPPAHPLVSFAILPRFQDKALERDALGAYTGIPLDARLRLDFDKVLTDPTGALVRGGQVDPNNRISDEVSYLFSLDGLKLVETGSGTELSGQSLWGVFPLATNPGEPAQTLELMSPNPAATLTVDERSLTQDQIDTITEQLRALCDAVPPAATRAATFDGQGLGPAQDWTLSHIDLRTVRAATFSMELVGAGWVNQQGGALADLASVVALPTVAFNDRRATDRALKLPKGKAGQVGIDIPRLVQRIETTVERGKRGLYVGIPGNADAPSSGQGLTGWALTTTAISQSFWELEGPSGAPRNGASRLSRAVLLRFPPIVAGRAVVVIKTGAKGGGAIWLDEQGAPIGDATLAFSGPLENASLAAGSAGSGDFAGHEARAILLTSTAARPATGLLLVGQLDADSFLIELSGVTVADEASRAAILAQQRASIDQITTRQSGIYADPLQRANRPLLKPNTDYRIEGRINWTRLRNGQTEETGSYDLAQSDAGALTFRTTNASLKNIGDYIHSIDPGDETLPLYANEPFRMTYRTDTLDELFKRFGERLVLRAKPARSDKVLIAVRADVTTRRFEALTPAERAVDATIRSSPCLNGVAPGAPRDQTSVTGLEINTPYEVALLPVPLSGAVPSDALLIQQLLNPAKGPVWSGRFRTSRYRSFGEHVAAFRAAPALDLVVDAGNIPGLPAVGALIRDDTVLQAATQLLFGGPLPLPEVCEIVRLWAAPATPSAAFQLVGVLLDGPEPFLRRLNGFDQVTIASSSPGITGVSGTRTVLGLSSRPASGALTLSLSYRRASGDAPVSESLTVRIPIQPY
ncbi:MAG: hypothetical protein ING90_17520 [Rhodocyclaceae bacterium]|nr:hypothetical protein [Rhodocyclaceae bacterium]MCA3124446.1 hypothetical protein [Rhodocyclaceae bacterium]